MKYTSEQLRKQLQTLPESEQDYLLSEEVAAKIRKISGAQALSQEHMGKLASAVGLVLLKLLKPEALAHELAVELDIPPSKATAAAAEVEREIFSKIGVKALGVRQEQSGEAESKPAQSLAPSVYKPSAPSVVPPHPVPIRKVPQPVAPVPKSPTTNYSLQTLLSDIRRGTAFDEARVAEAFRRVPVEVRQSLESVGFLSRLQDAARKFGLNVEETGELVSESGLVMLGLTKPHEFVDHLAHRLRLPKDRALAVGQAINMEVFRPVREILRKMGETSTTTADTGLRFAPPAKTTESPRNLPTGNFQNPSPAPSFTKGGEGGGFSPSTKYTPDPYRESLE